MRRTATVLLFVLVSGPIAAAQTIYHVDDDAAPGGDGLSWATAYDTLPPALTAAQPGDHIWVAAGTYVGNFTLALGVEMYGGFAGTETLLEQRDWTTHETILDGNQTGSVVTGPIGATETTRIDGFTITNGSGTFAHSREYGGGVYLFDSSPTVANNAITANTGTNGGGLYAQESSSTIVGNAITGNSASSGGGLDLYSASPTIVRNTITGNTGTLGGGLGLLQSSPTIANNVISNNSANGGGGLDLSESSPTIANNLIAGNGARGGGGLLLRLSSPTIANNTIVGNWATDSGGLRVEYLSSPTIVNTIIAFNSSGVRLEGDGTPTLRHNCVYGNADYDYHGLADPTGTDGNISADPELADPRYGNLHIQPNSPCRDAGDNADAWGDFDMDGEPRILPAGATVDIGADESDGTVWAEGPYAIVRVSPVGDDANDGASWASAKRTVQAGIDSAAALGGEVWVRSGTYQERIALNSFTQVYGGFAGMETMRHERDWVAHTTILDARQQGSVVTAHAGYSVSTVDGFTITGGNAEHGGGFYLSYSSLTIVNNTIAGNVASVGGGMHLLDSSPTIAKNRIIDNSAVWGGGGLYLKWSSPTFANNTVTGNGAGNWGGGLSLNSSSPMIEGCMITGNTAGDNGGGLYLSSYADPMIVNNVITGNTAGIFGGGLYAGYDPLPTIANNTVTGNSAGDGGGGLYLHSSRSPTIAGTIVALNSSGIYVSEYHYVVTPTMRSNCVSGNAEYDYFGLDDPTGTNGNVSVEPLFAVAPAPGLDGKWGTQDDDLGDLHLSVGSPCINTGDPATTLEADAVDLDGSPRVQGCRIDMGAYESDDPQLPGDFNDDGRFDLVDAAFMQLCFDAPESRPEWADTCLCVFDSNGDARLGAADYAEWHLLMTGP